MDIKKISENVEIILKEIGEDPTREGLVRTPKRVAEAYEFLTKGYRQDIDKVINSAIFDERYDEMVIVKDIDFYSLCEHHILPFYGKIHVAYIPDGKVMGLSKIPRIVDMYARRLQIQERMTQQIADVLEEKLQPKGVAVVAEGYHMCMMMRGVQKQNSITTTSAVHGAFRAEKTRLEFLNLIARKNI
ncbi:MAG: GTP cyclohydrolase I FolE [Bacteroidota bacterium]